MNEIEEWEGQGKTWFLQTFATLSEKKKELMLQEIRELADEESV